MRPRCPLRRPAILPFAMALNDQGKIRQLGFPEHPDRSAEETARFIETGLKLVAQQLSCKAVGFCSGFSGWQQSAS